MKYFNFKRLFLVGLKSEEMNAIFSFVLKLLSNKQSIKVKHTTNIATERLCEVYMQKLPWRGENMPLEAYKDGRGDRSECSDFHLPLQLLVSR